MCASRMTFVLRTRVAMEVEEGECSEDSSSSGGGEEETEVAEAADEEDSGEANGALLTALQQQLQRDVSWSCESHQFHEREEEEEEEEEEDEDKVPLAKLKELGSSDILRGMLANPHLHNLLLEIDGSASPQQALPRAMTIPVFVEFADECLRICGVRDNSDDV